MFEAEIESTKLRLAEMLLPSPSRGLYVLEVLDHPTLDPAYKEFVRAEVEWLLYQDRIQRQSNLPIDPNDPLFRSLWSQVEDYLRRHARFDRKHALSLLDAAVKSVLNYRIRPRVTLKWFVYRGEPTKPICEILLRLGYFADYRYFRDGFQRWMSERSLDASSTHIMPIFEFERLVKQIDDDYILDLSTTEFIELLDPVFAFFNDASTPLPLQTIPIEALIVFLDDKDIQVIAQKFERMLYHDGVRAVTRDTILRVVDQVLQELEGDRSGDETAPAKAVEETGSSETILEQHIGDRSEQAAVELETEESRSTDADVSALYGEATSDDEAPPVSDTEGEPDAIAQTAFAENAAHEQQPIASEEQHDETVDFDESSAVGTGEEEAIAHQPNVTDSPAPSLSDESVPSEEMLAESDIATNDEQHSSPERLPHESVLVVEDEITDSSVAADDQATSDSQVPEHEPMLDSSDSGLEIMPDDVSVMLADDPTMRENFVTETDEDLRALEREFDLEPLVASSVEDDAEGEAFDSTADDTTAAEQQLPSTQPSEQVPVLDEVLESGLKHVRVQAPSRTLHHPWLAEALGGELAEAVLKKLCERDRFRFEGLLARLDAAPTLRAALNELDSYLAQYGLDPAMKVAQELRMVLVKHFALS